MSYQTIKCQHISSRIAHWCEEPERSTPVGGSTQSVALDHYWKFSCGVHHFFKSLTAVICQRKQSYGDMNFRLCWFNPFNVMWLISKTNKQKGKTNQNVVICLKHHQKFNTFSFCPLSHIQLHYPILWHPCIPLINMLFFYSKTALYSTWPT